jgi:oxygen-independent coproporphyrinogen-3 oxidase
LAGIYIHIPFCKQACNYCNFHFSTTYKNYKNELVASLCNEIKWRKSYVGNEEIESIYFGGGTPSLLSKDELNLIMESIRRNFLLAPKLEVTFEANPDDLSIEYLTMLKQVGINRLSIGIQSFYDECLQFMHRAHNAKEAKTCILNAKEIGFDNLTIDLIFGTPTLTDDLWLNNLQIAVDLGIKHISCYGLTVEAQTPLFHQIKHKKIKSLNDNDSANQFLVTQEFLAKKGFLQYEISNYALEGHLAVHNTNYWLRQSYIGIGPSAHSYNGYQRQWNIANNNLYIQKITSLDKSVFEIEDLSKEDKYNEYIMLGLRTYFGINKSYIVSNFGNEYLKFLEKEIQPHIKNGLVKEQKDIYLLEKKGMLFADKITADCFKK